MSQRFKLNQIVRLVRDVPTGRNGTVPRDYEIVRIMPADSGGEISYRIRSGTTERAVRAFEIKE